MFLRPARCTAAAAAAVALMLALPQPSSAQTPSPAAAPSAPPAAKTQTPPPAATPSSPPAAAAPSSPPAAAATPISPPAAASSSAPPPTAAAPSAPVLPGGSATKPSDAFGEDAMLAAKPIVYIKGSGTWDKAFAIISGSLKKVEAYVAKAGLKTDGLPETIFLGTDDRGFDYEAAVPLAEAPKDPPHGEITAGQSPDGHALKFVHRGSYDSLDDTYEMITNYLDEKRLESKNVLIEQYVTDPVTADEKNLVVNIFVMVN
jgi:effector-binding domain-containing protein